MQDKMSLEAAFDLMVQLARSQKLTWDEHQKVNEAIQIVLDALNEKNEPPPED